MQRGYFFETSKNKVDKFTVQVNAGQELFINTTIILKQISFSVLNKTANHPIWGSITGRACVLENVLLMQFVLFLWDWPKFLKEATICNMGQLCRACKNSDRAVGFFGKDWNKVSSIFLKDFLFPLVMLRSKICTVPKHYIGECFHRKIIIVMVHNFT